MDFWSSVCHRDVPQSKALIGATVDESISCYCTCTPSGNSYHLDVTSCSDCKTECAEKCNNNYSEQCGTISDDDGGGISNDDDDYGGNGAPRSVTVCSWLLMLSGLLALNLNTI